MNSLSHHCSRLRRFITKYVGTILTSAPVAFLVMMFLAAGGMLSTLTGCSPKPTPPQNTRAPILTQTPALEPVDILPVIIPPTSTRTLYPSVMLKSPEDGDCLACRSDVALRWHCPYALREDESYQLEVDGPDSSLVYRKRNDYTLNALSTGQYNWAVTVVRSQGLGQYVAVSEESDTYRFEIAPPAPVVHSISPTSTVQGTSGLIVTVSGENFTHSLALTIGVPLRAIFVNSSTITATVPATLEVGEHPVIAKDSSGEGMSTVSFVVREPVLTPTPTMLPTKTPMYPPPELTGLEIIGCSVTFLWSWPGVLAEDEYYAVRYGIGGPGHSMAWVKEPSHIARLEKPGEYTWEVAICQGEPETHICNQLAVSEQQIFSFRGCDGK